MIYLFRGYFMELKRLSDVNPVQAFLMNEDNINDYVFQPKLSEIDLDEKYKIGLVLGCGNYEIMRARACEAINLYHNQIIEYLLLSGGIGFLSRNREESEAMVMRRFMLNNGVDDSDIIIEDSSRDTYENMKKSLRSIEKEVNKDEKLVVITSDFHSKRSKGILENMTNLDIYSHGILDGIHDFDIWNRTNLTAKKNIRIEAFLLSWYQKNGIINDQKISSRTRKKI